MSMDVVGIRIDPPMIEFVDAAMGEVMMAKLTVQNMSRSSKRIRFHIPVSNKFKLDVKNPSQPVAPGLMIETNVEYLNDTGEDYRDRIILTVDGDIIEIPLYAYMPTPLLDLEGPVDFGMVVAKSKVLSQEVALINHGSIAGEFKISYSGRLPIVIVPTSGKVNPKTIQLIKVELVTENPCMVQEVAKVKLEGQQDTELIINGCVVEQTLELLCRENSPMKCVSFGPAYYGTDIIHEAILYNNGPEEVKWVSVLEEGAAGEEVGTDLTKSTAATLATSPMERIRGKAYDVLTSLITVIPNQGILRAYQKSVICFRFSPRFNSSSVGWESSEKPPPRQDFALFMTFEIVGSNDSFLSEGKIRQPSVEVAVTATAVPVLVNIKPSYVFQFGDIKCDETRSAICALVNESAILPLTVKFRKVAHFTVSPMKVTIPTGHSKNISIKFQPTQAGIFQTVQMIDVIGKVLMSKDDSDIFPRLQLEKVQSILLHYHGAAAAVPKKILLRNNNTSLVSNATGQFADDTSNQSIQHKSQIGDSAMMKAHKTNLHGQDEKKYVGPSLIALPNDRDWSIRPSDKEVEYRTQFTRIERHTYIDPDYACVDGEELKRKEHKEKYIKFLRNAALERNVHNTVRLFKRHDDEVDIGLKPAAGLIPPRIIAKEIDGQGVNLIPAVPENLRLLTTRQLANQERTTTARPISDGLNAVPTTTRENADCKQPLSPQDLHRVIIGPPTIDFDQVCLRSTSTKQLSIINNLGQHIHIQVTIDCRELRQTSPLSQVVPPRSKAELNLVFESSIEGRFQRSISYTVNSKNDGHILVLANVVPVALELSVDKLILHPTSGAAIDAGYRSVLTLYNRRNYAAEFTWSPILADRGTAFSVRPAAGVVEAFKDLKCEVVFHPSYFAPLEGNFHLQVHNGNSMRLACAAVIGTTNVQFVERRIQFGIVPLNMKTVRTALLHNSGRNHALFYIINSNPFPGMTVSPVHGVVPVGGNAELRVCLQPSAVMKFDTWIRVNIRGCRTIDLRMGGTVEPPDVDVDVKTFKYGGVYCNSSVTIPFNLINRTSTRVKAEFNLAKYTDYTLCFPEEDIDDDPSDNLPLLPNMYLVELAGRQSLPCTLTFHPTSVASYDFDLPVSVNKVGAPSPSPSTFPPSPEPSEKHIITPRPVMSMLTTPRRRVVGTALKPLLCLSASRLEFSVPVSFMEMSVPDNSVGDRKHLMLTNNSELTIKWKLAVFETHDFLKDNSFTFVKPGGAWYKADDIQGTLEPDESYSLLIMFCPKKIGSFFYKIPVILNGDTERPYRHLELNATMPSPAITFDPLALVLTPVPLATTVFAEFNIIATGYHRESKLSVKVPEIEEDGGSNLHCFSVEFPEGSIIPQPTLAGNDVIESKPVTLPCILSFSSVKPVSACVDITFTDGDNKKFVIPVTATADNCLLTVYPFLAAHRNDYQIVCEQDKAIRGPAHDSNSVILGEAIILPCTSSQRASTRESTSATSSHFGASSSTYEDSSNSVSDSRTVDSTYLCSCYTILCFSSPISLSMSSDSRSESEFTQTPRDGAAQHVAALEVETVPASRSKSHPQSEEPLVAITTSHFDPKCTHSEPHVTAHRDLVSRSLGSAAFPFKSSIEAHFHHEVLQAVQSWFSNYGWPGGPFPVSVPHSLRTLITRTPYDDSSAILPRNKMYGQRSQQLLVEPTMKVYTGCDTSNLRKDVKTIYDMLQHMCGRMVPGIPINQPLPRDPTERVLQLYWQHSTLLTFLRGQGASIAAIRPEFLFTPRDYRRWVKICEKEANKNNEHTAAIRLNSEIYEATQNKGKLTPSVLHIEEELFESVSKRTWTDLLLQMLKVLVLSRVTAKCYQGMNSLVEGHLLPSMNTDPLASNVYSVGERIILAWMNHHYEIQRHKVWGNLGSIRGSKGGVPPSRWVVNFDYDLLDGLVLAAVLAAHCPWLVKQCLCDMYTTPASPEQCLHNTLILVNALGQIGIDYNIQATDITDPNPITLLLLCVHLYQHLPQYLPRSKVKFTGALHTIIHRQVRINNPSGRHLVYMVQVWGKDAQDFYLPNGNELHVPSKCERNLDIEFASRFLHPAEAILVLVGGRESAAVGASNGSIAVGSTLVFNLEASVDEVKPLEMVKCETTCYESKTVEMQIINPFPQGGNFKISLVESCNSLPAPVDIELGQSGKTKKSTLSSRIKFVKAKTDHGQKKHKENQRTQSVADGSQDKCETTVTNNMPDMKIAKNNTKRQSHSQLARQFNTFFSKDTHVYLETEMPSILKVNFLPFNVGKKYCTVLFSSEIVGDFIYAIEANATLPLLSHVPMNTKSQQSVRISSAAAADHGKGLFGGNERVVYWKCETGKELNETLLLPITNEAKERALVIAAQQRMSSREKKRRMLTGTLESGTVTAGIVAMGMPDAALQTKALAPLSAPPTSLGITFSIESSSDFYHFPAMINIPLPMTFGPLPASEIKGSCYGPNDRQDDGVVPVKVRFKPKGPGHYPCDIVLRSPSDVRVYRIECITTPVGTVANFDFKIPAHQRVTQNIPIQNASNYDWDLECMLQGTGFSGPGSLLVKCGATAYYPLTFKPQFECNIHGKLIIQNRSNGTMHMFDLVGVGERPLAQASLKIKCQCQKITARTIDIPNYTQRKLVYDVRSDIPFLDGPPTITVLAGQTAAYAFTVCPWVRGKYTGRISFRGKEHDMVKVSDDSDTDEDGDSCTERLPSSNHDKQDCRSDYRVWYSVFIDAAAPPPERKIEIVCPAQQHSVLKIPINNPTAEQLVLTVDVSGSDLFGESKVTIQPRIQATYQLIYSPQVIGRGGGNVIFQSAKTGEFWYELDLHAVSPSPITIPRMDCELGHWTRRYISISNTTVIPMKMVAELANECNFSLDLKKEGERPVITVPPCSTVDIPIQFMPTSLGSGKHQTTVKLLSEELGEVIYWVSGCGFAPKPMEPVSVSAIIGSNTSLVLPFRNPTDAPAYADIYLSDVDHTMNQMSDSVIRNCITVDSAFCLLLKHTTSIPIAPRQSIDVPFIFSPDKMRMYESMLSISLRREDGKTWDNENESIEDLANSTSQNAERNDQSFLQSLGFDDDGGVRAIKWLYPIHGIPEIRSKQSKEATLHCQTRSRIEERLEVTLAGAVSGSSSSHELARLRAVTPLDKHRDNRFMTEGVTVDGHVVEEFSYSIDYSTDKARKMLEPALVVTLVRKERDPHSGLVTLLFNVVFTPFRPLSQTVTLTVSSAIGGIWRFPLTVKASECPPDDTIKLEAAGLGKTSVVTFTLFSHSKHPTPFHAFFVHGSDPEITVTPQNGELLPQGSQGTQIHIAFTPSIYGRSYKARLIVQTPGMQWSYDVCGVPPEYKAPKVPSATFSSKISGASTLTHRRRLNYIKKNIKITATGASSPMKGTSLIIKSK